MSDRNRVTMMVDEISVILVGCHAECTKCGEMKPLSEFGLRLLRRYGPDEIRNQAQCLECR